MASDKPNGKLAITGPVAGEVDATEFLRHLHGDIISLATEHTTIFRGVAILVVERFIFYSFAFMNWLFL